MSHSEAGGALATPLKIFSNGMMALDANGKCVIQLWSRDSSKTLPAIIERVNNWDALVAALAFYEQAISEAEAILGGEYGLTFGPFFDLVCKAREAKP